MEKILYIANIRLPTEKAHGLQIMKMCEAFSNLQSPISNFQSNSNDQIPKKIEVELIIPWRFNKIKADPFKYYGVEENFKIIKVPSLDLVKLGKIGFWLQSVSFSKFSQCYALFKARDADVIYSRDPLPLFWLSFYRKNIFWGLPGNIFWEAHRGEFNFIVKRLLKKCRGIIAITQGLKNFYVAKGIEADRILVAPDAVDLEKFDIKVSKEEAREKLKLPQDKKIILYTGHLYNWKGATVLLEAARKFSIFNFQFLKNTLFVFVGGTDKDIQSFKSQITNYKLQNVMIAGYRPYGEIPYWLKAADVLVLPNSAKEKISEIYTSPMKMFEYMTSGAPIVAADLPSIREILNEKNSILVRPDSLASLINGISKALEDPDLAEKISKQAYLDVQNHTWKKRAEKILNFIKNDVQ